jgi:hypothetical protein
MQEANAILEEANKLASSLNSKDLYNLNAVMRPNDSIVIVMEICCHMFGFKPTKAN